MCACVCVRARACGVCVCVCVKTGKTILRDIEANTLQTHNESAGCCVVVFSSEKKITTQKQSQ